MTKKFVIDADIARSAGESSTPESSSARGLLENVYEGDHHVCFCKKLSTEWCNHMSQYSKRWLARMYSRKRVKVIVHNEDVHNDLSMLTECDHSKKTIALKDSHLVDIAINADKIIFSNDLKAKRAISELLPMSTKIRDVVWISPLKAKQDIDDCFFTNNKSQNSLSEIHYLRSVP